MNKLKLLNDIEPIKWISCEVIKEVGYHDDHKIGEVISVNSKHVDEMVKYGYIKVIGVGEF